MYADAIIVAAGKGTRMGGATSKAFLPLGGTPLALHSLRTFSTVERVRSIVLVVAGDALDRAREIIDRNGPWPVPVALTVGGAERQDSVAAGVSQIEHPGSLVMIHDAARPFVTTDSVKACLEAAVIHGAAILAVPARDTVKLVDPDAVVSRTVERQTVWLAQTPQAFRFELLRNAFAAARRDGYSATDDAALVEHIGAKVHVVAGDPSNIKITTLEDLQWAEWFLHHRGAPR